jgi:lysophospholipase L1-like esterase
VAAGAEARTIVAIGDSVTDGHGSGRDHNARWTDAFAERLQADPALASIAVANAGISGNRLLKDGPIGPSMLARFDRDVLDKPGLAWVVLDAGLNDIGLSDDPDSPADNVSAQQIIDGMKTLIARAHARGISIIGATLLPYAGAEDPLRYSAAGEAKRQALNAWIRGAGAFDAVVDFEAVTRDPAQPDRLLPAFDSGDHIHPNDAGYQAMAASISLRLFVEMSRHPGT